MKPLLLTLLSSALVLAADLPLGKPLALKEPVAIEKLMAKPAVYANKPVQVKGTVTAVCQNMGCWMALTTADTTVRIKVDDGEIVFPKDAIGKVATAEGKFVKAGDSWQIRGTGAVIHE
ncbi:MAG TPA: DUF4920 domain-containing protein [Bryobacteraceae bacterium]|nr:DUF4920 domain-containing protein [Bryobacteraceae bacterium]